MHHYFALTVAFLFLISWLPTLIVDYSSTDPNTKASVGWRTVVNVVSELLIIIIVGIWVGWDIISDEAKVGSSIFKNFIPKF